jgi:hypothetical protein
VAGSPRARQSTIVARDRVQVGEASSVRAQSSSVKARPRARQDSGIPRGGRASIGLPHEAQVEAIRIRGHEGVERFGAPVVDDDDFERECSGFEARDRVQTAPQRGGPGERRHDDGGGRRVSHVTMTSG